MNRFLFFRRLIVRGFGLWVVLFLGGACDKLTVMDGVGAKQAAREGSFEDIDRRIEGGAFTDLTRLASILSSVGSDECVSRLEKIALSKDETVQLAVYHGCKNLSPDRRRRVLNVLTKSASDKVRKNASEELSKLQIKDASQRKPL